MGVKVIWSLRDKAIPENNPNFWISAWIPQVEVLSHPAIKCGLSHGGFGGCLEFINAGVPMVCFPHFSDSFSCIMQCVTYCDFR